MPEAAHLASPPEGYSPTKTDLVELAKFVVRSDLASGYDHVSINMGEGDQLWVIGDKFAERQQSQRFTSESVADALPGENGRG